MKNWSLGKKIGAGFAIILILLTIVSFWATNGVGNIVKNADEVIDGNKLRGEMVQKEVDHLNWANKVNALLTDDKVSELNVETDPHKCAFGVWFYGEGRKQAEILLPILKPFFADIEKYHTNLHESAIKIGKTFKHADISLPMFLTEKELDHLNWKDKINTCFVENSEHLQVETDDHKCGLGKFIYGEEGTKIQKSDHGLSKLLDELKVPHEKLHKSASKIVNEWKQKHTGLSEALKNYLDQHKNWVIKLTRTIINKEKSIEVELDPTKCAFGKFLISKEAEEYSKNFTEFKAAIEACKKPHEELHNSAANMAKVLHDVSDETEANKAISKIYQEQSLPALQSVEEHFQKAIKAEELLVKAQATCKDILDKETIPALTETQKALKSLKTVAVENLNGMREANNIFSNETKPALEKVQSLLKKINETVKENVMTDEEMLLTASKTRMAVITFSIIAFIIAIFLAFFLTKGITKVLRNIIVSLSCGAEQVSAASEQVAMSSQNMAEGASEQASSLEEVSSSLEEMSSMTKQNAENAKQANISAIETRDAAANGATAMSRMSDAINQIKNSSDKTAKIIKTIDEIAFQTNLLALNAAVEAARAGEAGKGFAVVAEEVRNLAQRSAAAAKNTAELIEESQKNSENGVQVSNEVAAILDKIEIGVKKVTQIIEEVSVASKEQSQGIEQINTAISQMDKVTQSNAANAEESASASEELSGQAIELSEIVKVLRTIVEGLSNENTFSLNNPKEKSPKPEKVYPKYSHTSYHEASDKKNRPQQIKSSNLKKIKTVKPDEIIPLEEKDLN